VGGSREAEGILGLRVDFQKEGRGGQKGGKGGKKQKLKERKFSEGDEQERGRRKTIENCKRLQNEEYKGSESF